jgi:integrase
MKKLLNDRFIQSIAAPLSGRIEVTDLKIAGFTLRVTPKNKKTFSFAYRMPGNPIKKRLQLGTYPALSLAEARNKCKEALGEIQNNIDPSASKKDSKQMPTIKELIEEFWERELSKKKSAKDMLRLLEKDVIPAWGSMKASSITRRDVVVLLDKIRDRGAPVMANRVHGRLTRLFNFACERGILNASPMVRLRKTTEEPRERVLDNSEIKAFWNKIDSIDLHPSTVIALKLMLLTGQRAGEVINIEWTEINFENKLWSIPAEKSKNNRSHTVPLTKTCLALLDLAKNLNSSNYWVFPSPQKRETPKAIEVRSLSKALSRKLTDLGIKKFVPHDLRRTVRTKLAELGIDEIVAERVLNHQLQGLAVKILT